jgi:hypothetical protein
MSRGVIAAEYIMAFVGTIVDFCTGGGTSFLRILGVGNDILDWASERKRELRAELARRGEAVKRGWKRSVTVGVIFGIAKSLIMNGLKIPSIVDVLLGYAFDSGEYLLSRQDALY